MIEFDTCLATADRIQSPVHAAHAPAPYYHHHPGHPHLGHHHTLHPVEQVNSAVSHHHPRLNSLLTRTAPCSTEQIAPTTHLSPPIGVHPSHTSHSPQALNSHSVLSPNKNQSTSHHPNGAMGPKKGSDRTGATHPHSNSQSSGKKHSQIVSKLQQSISSRLKQNGHQDLPPLAGNPASASRTHSLPPQSTPSSLTTLVSLTGASPAVIATKSSFKISNHSNQSAVKVSSEPVAYSPDEHLDAEALKRKKKSHLSRDELARVCSNGDVTFESYNGSEYMISIRSMGDRKSLIGYRCDWNLCGYMNARVERMFGHIRSQHPEAPTVKKLVTTTGATMTTSTVTTTTSAASGSSSTTSTSARLSLRSSSSLSTASSLSSDPISPHPANSGSPDTPKSTLHSPLKAEPTSSGPKVKKSKATKSTSTPSEMESVVLNSSSSSSNHVDASPAVDALLNLEPGSHREEKLLDLLKQNSDGGVHIKEEILDNVHHPLSTPDDMIDIGLDDIKVERSSPLAALGGEVHFDDKLAVLDPLQLAESTEQIMAELKTISSNCEQQAVATVSQVPVTVNGDFATPAATGQLHQSSAAAAAAAAAAGSFASPVDRNNNHQMNAGGSVAVSRPMNECNTENLVASTSIGQPAAMRQPAGSAIAKNELVLFDAEIESLLMSDPHPEGKPPCYPQDSFPLQEVKYIADTSEPHTMVLEHNVTFQGQPQTLLRDQSPHESVPYENFASMNPYESANGEMALEEKLSHSHSIGSDGMMFEGENGSLEMDPSLMMDEGSMGSNNSAKQKAATKKSGSSKNYIGKQNLFQEFQSEEVAKVRDSENKYIIALQKNMKIVGYRCDWPECEFLTCRKYVMVNHINGKHTNQRPYSCPLCNFNFVKRYFLKAHMHKVHKRRISIDGKDEDDDGPLGGDKRDHDDLESFDETQFGGIDTPETPGTIVAGLAVVPPKKKQKGSPPAYSSESKGAVYYPNGHSGEPPFGQYGACTPTGGRAATETYPSSAPAGDIPATVQQYSYNSTNGAYSADPMISGHASSHPSAVNGTGFYGDDSYGSDLSTSANGINSGFKGNQRNSSVQQSAVFMTPSPSSSISSPLPFTATGPTTPVPKGAFPAMYDSGNSFDGQVYGPANGAYNQQQQQQQQPPFHSRTYSQSSQSSGGMYASNGHSPKAANNGMPLVQVDLLTPPLSNGTSSNGNCCRSNSISAPTGGPFQAGEAFSSFTDSSVPPSYPINSNGFEDFLSPPSSISSSGSNFSGSYINTSLCPEQASPNGSSTSVNGSTQRQASVGGCTSTLSGSQASMANASSFYLHTPSPSPSSLSHSPASGPTYGTPGANSYNTMAQGGQQSQYQTNFSNTFPTSDGAQGYPQGKQPYTGQPMPRPNMPQPYSNAPQSQMYGNSYESSSYFEAENPYSGSNSASGRNGPTKSATAPSNGNSFYASGNSTFVPSVNTTNGLFDSYAEAYPMGAATAMPPKAMYPTASHPIAAGQVQPFISNGAQCWTNPW